MFKKILAAFLPPVVLRVRDFTPFLAMAISGREGGRNFRKDVLMPPLTQGRTVVLVFDGLSVGSAWLNEVFAHPDVKEFTSRIRFGSTDYYRIYDKISTNFLRGVRPYTG